MSDIKHRLLQFSTRNFYRVQITSAFSSNHYKNGVKTNTVTSLRLCKILRIVLSFLRAT